MYFRCLASLLCDFSGVVHISVRNRIIAGYLSGLGIRLQSQRLAVQFLTVLLWKGMDLMILRVPSSPAIQRSLRSSKLYLASVFLFIYNACCGFLFLQHFFTLCTKSPNFVFFFFFLYFSLSFLFTLQIYTNSFECFDRNWNRWKLIWSYKLAQS